MDKEKLRQKIPAPLGYIEPHAGMLTIPPNGQLLYKVMKVENLLRSIKDGYLHFNRVDMYRDFPNADPNDGSQLPNDYPDNVAKKFEKMPDFSLADYYNRSRARTYACCFSLENSDFIWNNYGGGGDRGRICVVFNFGKFRSMLNQTLEPGNVFLEYNGYKCFQIFSINYGLIEYIDRNTCQISS